MIVLFIYFLLIFNSFLFSTAFSKIRNSKGKIDFIYSWAFLYGAFVWEDLLIFSLYFFIVSLVVILTGELKIGLLLFIIFWVIRSAGETLYFFLQQFIRPSHFPHAIDLHFKIHHLFLGNISQQKSFIIMQVFFQAILMAACAALVFLLINWTTIGWVL